MVTDPFRLRVMKNLVALLQEIVPDSNSGGGEGYRHDLTNAVFRGRKTFTDDTDEVEGDPLPMVSVLEMPLALDQLPSPPESPIQGGDWDLLIQGFVEDDKDNPTDPAYRLAADVIRRLAFEKARHGRERKTTGFRGEPLLGEQGVTNIIIGSPVIRPPDEISAKAYFWLQITVQVVENLEDPYG